MAEKEKTDAHPQHGAGIAEDPKIVEAMANIKHKILIISNKGGVGKSMLAVNLAVALGVRNKKVGLLDIDIHGPSVTKMLGIDPRANPLEVQDEKIVPAKVHGVHVISMGFLLADNDMPVIWRGPLKANLIRQFLGDAKWDSLDFLVVDSPPGTGDEPLTILQILPGVDGAIIITTPQEVALLDSGKAVNFVRKLNIPVLGMVENMAWMKCPHCGERIDLFKGENLKKMAARLKVNVLGALPFEPDVMAAGDIGKPIVLEKSEGPVAHEIFKIVDGIIEILV